MKKLLHNGNLTTLALAALLLGSSLLVGVVMAHPPAQSAVALPSAKALADVPEGLHANSDRPAVSQAQEQPAASFRQEAKLLNFGGYFRSYLHMTEDYQFLPRCDFVTENGKGLTVNFYRGTDFGQPSRGTILLPAAYYGESAAAQLWEMQNLMPLREQQQVFENSFYLPMRAGRDAILFALRGGENPLDWQLAYLKTLMNEKWAVLAQSGELLLPMQMTLFSGSGKEAATQVNPALSDAERKSLQDAQTKLVQESALLQGLDELTVQEEQWTTLLPMLQEDMVSLEQVCSFYSPYSGIDPLRIMSDEVFEIHRKYTRLLSSGALEAISPIKNAIPPEKALTLAHALTELETGTPLRAEDYAAELYLEQGGYPQNYALWIVNLHKRPKTENGVTTNEGYTVTIDAMTGKVMDTKRFRIQLAQKVVGKEAYPACKLGFETLAALGE